jgi:hypothetical protein
MTLRHLIQKKLESAPNSHLFAEKITDEILQMFNREIDSLMPTSIEAKGHEVLAEGMSCCPGATYHRLFIDDAGFGYERALLDVKEIMK